MPCGGLSLQLTKCTFCYRNVNSTTTLIRPFFISYNSSDFFAEKRQKKTFDSGFALKDVLNYLKYDLQGFFSLKELTRYHSSSRAV